jgi:hypothetical protein
MHCSSFFGESAVAGMAEAAMIATPNRHRANADRIISTREPLRRA